jgi:hypothetical protein
MANELCLSLAVNPFTIKKVLIIVALGSPGRTLVKVEKSNFSIMIPGNHILCWYSLESYSINVKSYSSSTWIAIEGRKIGVH